MASAQRRAAWSGSKAHRRLFVPPEAAGLLAAIAASRVGQHDALCLWDRVARPKIAQAMERAGVDPASIDESIAYLLERAHDAARARRRTEHELAWMSAVLTSAWFRTRSRERPERRARLLAAARASAERQRETGHDAEAREELEVAAARLPQRFGLVIRLYLRGLDAREVRTALCAELTARPEQARRIEVSAFARMRTALGASESGTRPGRAKRFPESRWDPGREQTLPG